MRESLKTLRVPFLLELGDSNSIRRAESCLPDK